MDYRSVVCGYIILLITILTTSAEISDDTSDICLDILNPNFLEEMSKFIFVSHLPKAGAEAGTYLKVAEEVKSWHDCLELCCSKTDFCDVALHTGTQCFYIHCNDSLPGACLPVLSTSPKHNETVMVVRNIRQLESRDMVPQTQPLLDGYSTSTTTTTTTTTSSTAPETLAPSTASPADAAPSGTGSKGKQVGQNCTYGMMECAKDAICEVKEEDAASKGGHCRCTEGFLETADHLCEKNSDVVPQPQATQQQNADTTKAPVITETPVTKLTVSAGTNKTLQLPEDSVSLTAYVIPSPDPGEVYTYEWLPLEIPQNSESAVMDGKNKNILYLSKLVPGLYVLKIKVTGNNKLGEATINVTVLPAKRENQPPQAIIVPPFQEVNLPNVAYLDGSDSKDDVEIVSYKWEEVSGPLTQENKMVLTNKMLTLKDMVPGNYTFRLTVTDTDGATSSAQANVTIKKEKDYPPNADAGSDVVIHLPQTSLNLSGVKSFDDKGNLTYEWINAGDAKMTAGMVGVRSPILQLSNLNVGDYTFILKVTDSAGQTDSAEVHVFVKAQTNNPPEAKTAGHLQVYLPQESLTLDGSNSTDDSSKMEFAWSQTGGPSPLTINNANSVVAIATGNLLEGDYEFSLTVTDGDHQKATDKLIITVKKDVNLPPKADAGGNQVLQLPVSLVTLDGSRSSDDRGIKKYLWKRDSKSLAAGAIVNNSDHKAVLQLVNLVAGQYLFTLTVEDADGQQGTDSATVVINRNPHERDVVEMLLDADIDHFTVAHKESLQDQLELMLQKSPEDRNTMVEFISVSEDVTMGNLCLRFLVLRSSTDTNTVVNGVQALKTLKPKLSSGKILDYSVVRVDLSVCQNNCSGHGHCDQKTKVCVCEAFWMPNFFTSSLFSTESNCDWSVLYVVIICFIILVSIISSIWAIICCCTSKKCKITLKARRRHRYSLLRDADDAEKDKLEMLTKGKIQNSSVMISESDLSSDEETLFISNKKVSNGVNGKLNNNNNGSSRQGHRSKLKT